MDTPLSLILARHNDRVQRRAIARPLQRLVRRLTVTIPSSHSLFYSLFFFSRCYVFRVRVPLLSFSFHRAYFSHQQFLEPHLQAPEEIQLTQ